MREPECSFRMSRKAYGHISKEKRGDTKPQTRIPAGGPMNAVRKDGYTAKCRNGEEALIVGERAHGESWDIRIQPEIPEETILSGTFRFILLKMPPVSVWTFSEIIS